MRFIIEIDPEAEEWEVDYLREAIDQAGGYLSFKEEE